MNRFYITAPLLVLIFFLFSCGNGQNEIPKTDTDVATAFIRDILDNRIDEAEKYLLKDDTNDDFFKRFSEQYRRKEKAELEKYKSAEIIINEISNVTDSVTIVNYSNTYKKDQKNKLKLVRINGHWLIDLKYTFSGNM